MEVLVGPTFTIDVSSSSTPGAADGRAVMFLDELGGKGSGFVIAGRPEFASINDEDSSESSSSIGSPGDSEDDVSFKGEGEDEGEEVQSKWRREGLGSLNSLEDSLPIKRGLSNHFSGKSKSFQDISQISGVSEAKELEKRENPFNKRRRILIASKWSRRSSFYSWSNPQSMPLLPVEEHRDESDEEKLAKQDTSPSSSSSSSSSSEEIKKLESQDQQEQDRGFNRPSFDAKMRLRLKNFKSKCFSLTDLQEHDEENEEED